MEKISVRRWVAKNGAPEETRTPDLLIRSHKSKQITICNLLTLRVMENVE